MQPPVRARGRWRHWTGSILPLLAVALLVMSPAHAKDRRGKHHDPATPAQTEQPPRNPPPGAPPREDLREPPREIREVSLDRVIEQVEKRHHARVVRYEKADADGRSVYVLRLLSDEGRVWTVKVDAETGKEQ